MKQDIHYVSNDLGFSTVLRKYSEFLFNILGKGYIKFGIASQKAASKRFPAFSFYFVKK